MAELCDGSVTRAATKDSLTKDGSFVDDLSDLISVSIAWKQPEPTQTTDGANDTLSVLKENFPREGETADKKSSQEVFQRRNFGVRFLLCVEVAEAVQCSQARLIKASIDDFSSFRNDLSRLECKDFNVENPQF